MKYPTLRELLEINSKRRVCSGFIGEFGLVSYYRKAVRYIDGDYVTVLEQANTLNPNKASNVIYLPPESYVRTGNYEKLINHALTLAKQYGYYGLIVENVLNDFLPDVLVRYGFTEIPRYEQEAPPSFIKLVESN